MTDAAQPLVGIRCPFCNALGAEASPGSRVRVKCRRCHAVFTRDVAPLAPDQGAAL